MNTLEVIRAVRDLLKEKDWCRNYFAHDKDGKPVFEFDADAHSFCLSGAINRVIFVHKLHVSPIRNEARREIIKDLPFVHSLNGGEITTFNDLVARNKEDVLVQLDITIRRLEKEQCSQSD